MGRLTRFGVSMDKSLLKAFDEYVLKREYKNCGSKIEWQGTLCARNRGGGR